MIKKFVFCVGISVLLSNYVFASDCDINHESIRFYEQFSNSNPSNVCSLYNLANEYVLKHKIQKALNVYEEIIELNPNEEKAYKKRAELYSKYNDNKLAEREYGRLVKNIPNSVLGNYHMADIYNNISDYEKALQYINKAIELSDKKNSGRVFLFITRADILKNMGKYKEAIEDYKIYAESDDSFSYSAYWDIMECYEAIGNKEKAKEAERKWKSCLYRDKYKTPLTRKIKWKYTNIKDKFYTYNLY